MSTDHHGDWGTNSTDTTMDRIFKITAETDDNGNKLAVYGVDAIGDYHTRIERYSDRMAGEPEDVGMPEQVVEITYDALPKIIAAPQAIMHTRER